jgi:beta-lactamase regulating signal transducer with metallopeptidase domain/protocatechuate 3,4-dioxygenase beta subunit
MCYLLGVLGMFGRLLFGLRGGSRLRQLSLPVQEPQLLEMLARQAKALGLSFTPALAYCEKVVVPTVVGVVRPAILLPVSVLSGLSSDQVEALLAHELAHIRRFDHLVNLAQRVVEAVLFFHPAMWIISRRIRIERENCCDDMVVATGGEAVAYAASLVRMAELSRCAERKGRLATSAALMATRGPSGLRRRVVRLLGAPQHEQLRVRHSWTFALGLVAVGALLTAAYVNTWAAQSAGTERSNSEKSSSTARSAAVPELTRETLLNIIKKKRDSITTCHFKWSVRAEVKVEQETNKGVPKYCEYEVTRSDGKVRATFGFEKGAPPMWFTIWNGKVLKKWCPVAKKGQIGNASDLSSAFTGANSPLHFAMLADTNDRLWYQGVVKTYDLAAVLENPHTIVATEKHGGIEAIVVKEGNHTIWLDPARGYAVVEQVYDAGLGRPLFKWENVTLQDCGNGLWMPTEMVTEDYLSRNSTGGPAGALSLVRATKATVLEINREYPDSLFDLQFPEGTKVDDHVTNMTYESGTETTDAGIIRDSAACQMNLELIVKGIKTYESQNNYQLPRSLADLFPQYLTNPKVLVCPADKTPMTIKNGLACSYRYIGNVRRDFGSLFIVYDHAQHDGGRNVAYYDGDVHHVAEQDFKAALAKMYEQLKPLMAKADFPGDRERVKAFCEDKDFPEEAPSATPPAAPPVEHKPSVSAGVSTEVKAAAEKSDKVVRCDGIMVEISYAALEELLGAEKVTLKEQVASQEGIAGAGDATFLYAILTPAKAQAFETRIKQMIAESHLKTISAPRVAALDGQAASLTIDRMTDTETAVSGYRPALSDKGQIVLVPTLSRYAKQGNRLNIVSKVMEGAIECHLKLESAEQIGSVPVEKSSVESPVISYQQALSLACTVENNGGILIVPPLPLHLIDNVPAKQQLAVMMLNLSASPKGSSAAPPETTTQTPAIPYSAAEKASASNPLISVSSLAGVSFIPDIGIWSVHYGWHKRQPLFFILSDDPSGEQGCSDTLFFFNRWYGEYLPKTPVSTRISYHCDGETMEVNGEKYTLSKGRVFPISSSREPKVRQFAVALKDNATMGEFRERLLKNEQIRDILSEGAGLSPQSDLNSGAPTGNSTQTARGASVPAASKEEPVEASAFPVQPNSNEATVTGCVVDKDGRPVADARVVLYYNRNRWGLHNRVADETRSAKDGIFTFSGLVYEARTESFGISESNEYWIFATHPKYAVGWKRVPPGKAGESLQVVLGDPGECAVTVVDDQGKPLEGARVWLHQAGDRQGKRPEYREYFYINDDLDLAAATTGPDGKARISNLPDTTLSFYASKEGYSDTWRGGRHIGDTVDFPLTRGGILRGQVTFAESGKPASGVVVWLYPKWGFTPTTSRRRIKTVGMNSKRLRRTGGTRDGSPQTERPARTTSRWTLVRRRRATSLAPQLSFCSRASRSRTST